jgi:hypothetical protein
VVTNMYKPCCLVTGIFTWFWLERSGLATHMQSQARSEQEYQHLTLIQPRTTLHISPSLDQVLLNVTAAMLLLNTLFRNQQLAQWMIPAQGASSASFLPPWVLPPVQEYLCSKMSLTLPGVCQAQVSAPLPPWHQPGAAVSILLNGKKNSEMTLKQRMTLNLLQPWSLPPPQLWYIPPHWRTTSDSLQDCQKTGLAKLKPLRRISTVKNLQSAMTKSSGMKNLALSTSTTLRQWRMISKGATNSIGPNS